MPRRKSHKPRPFEIVMDESRGKAIPWDLDEHFNGCLAAYQLIALLDKLGYRVVASSRRAEQEREYLQGLGADEIIDARELSGTGGPVGERWAGAVDSLGSRTLANVLSQINYDGAVAACGLAQGSDLPATVMPFILRDVTLAGVNSVLTPHEKREQAWSPSGNGPRPRQAQQHDVAGET
jgi:NADPH:quinone reductase-like Zn-dependent oxidoreductase